MKRLCLVGFAAALTATSAAADCYDLYGCTDRNYFSVPVLLQPGPTCEFLYTMRNEIYAEHHYCFRTARAIAAFGNQGCVTGDPNALGLNRFERANAATILRAEKTMACPQ